jgi:hypothetical protein
MESNPFFGGSSSLGEVRFYGDAYTPAYVASVVTGYRRTKTNHRRRYRSPSAL